MRLVPVEGLTWGHSAGLGPHMYTFNFEDYGRDVYHPVIGGKVHMPRRPTSWRRWPRICWRAVLATLQMEVFKTCGASDAV